MWGRAVSTVHAGRCFAVPDQVFDAVRTLLAVREYQDQPIPDEVVRRIVEAGHLNASSMNLQPWHFVLVRDRGHLGALAGLLPTGRYTAGAAFAVVVAAEKQSRYAVSDCSRAIQSMMLTAWSEGVGSNWVGFGGLEAVGAEVGLPDSYDVLAVVPFGYPARPLGAGRKKRKPLGEVVSVERYGAPFRAADA